MSRGGSWYYSLDVPLMKGKIMTSTLNRPVTPATESNIRELLLPARDGDKIRCGAIVHNGVVYFGHTVDVATLVKLHSDKDTKYCGHEAHYGCLGDLACTDHLLALLSDKLPYFAGNKVAVEIF